MRKIQLRDAQANLSAVVDQAACGKPSIITRHGKPQAVVLGFAEWERPSRVPSFRRLLMAAPIQPGDLPECTDARRRPVTRYLFHTNIISATAPTAAVSLPELIE